MLRGIRSAKDYEYEHAMRHINEDIYSGIQTVALIPPRKISEISSSMVKGLIGFDNWEEVITNYVPDYVIEKIKEKTNVGMC